MSTAPPRGALGAAVPRGGPSAAARVPVTPTQWRTSVRLIPSRYPTVGLFDAIADAADLDAVFAIEALTNPRIRDELGDRKSVV